MFQRKRNVKSRRRPMKGKVSKPVKKYVKKVLDDRVENKYLDLVQNIAAASAATDTTGSVVLLSGMSQGLTFATRIGETVVPKWLELRYDTKDGGGVTVDAVTMFRVIVFRDNQIRTSTLPAVTDVLEAAAYNSPINHVAINASRFTILHDRLHEMPPIEASQISDTSFQSVNKKIKLRGKIVYTNASTGTQKGNIYVLYISNGLTSGTPRNSPPINMYSRLVFEDA